MTSRIQRRGANPNRPITLAILAMGGQGGGVLMDWIVDLAEHNGYIAQATSVPGVAQRTGSTIYCIELFAKSAAREQLPVLALMPVPGEMDIVMAAEWMEAGRAMLRGLVSPDRTTLITSSHREYATVEKIVPGNGVADAQEVLAATSRHAQRLIQGDFRALAQQCGSVISAVMFGVLAGSDELPFDDDAFCATIERAGVGVAASLRAFRAGVEMARGAPAAPPPETSMDTPPRPLPERAASAEVEPLRQRIVQALPASVHAMAGAGLQRVVEFQDVAYGNEYLDRLCDLHSLALQCGDAGHGHAATLEAARWIAVAMAYDDVIRVADLKTRADRFDRIRQELGASDQEPVGITDYFHPRLQEIEGLLPSHWAARLERTPVLRRLVASVLERGLRIRTHTVTGHLMLRALSGLRRWRRNSTRHAQETAHLQHWLDTVRSLMPVNHALALELLRCRRLVKGYSDTHQRGSSKFDRVLHAAQWLRDRPDGAADLARLHAAAHADASGAELDRCWQRLGLPAITEARSPTP